MNTNHRMLDKLDKLTKSSITIPTKYIILFWIIALILFTFYCLFRLWYLGAPARIDKFNDSILAIPTGNVNPINPNATNINAIQYADNLLAKDQITDVPACVNTFDDNYGVRALGYRSCNDALADYIVKGLDTSNTYGAPKSVADYCPVTTKSPQYMQCMASLLEKYNTGANMLQGVSNDMSALVNKRLEARSNVLNNIQLEVAPYIGSNQIKDFELNTGLLGTANQTSDDKLYSASRYFQNKYGSKVSVFANISPSLSSNSSNTSNSSNPVIEGFANTSIDITVEPYIIKNFFGEFSPVKGQYLAFDNLQVSLDFIKDNTTTTEDTSSTTGDEEPSNVGKVSLVLLDVNTKGQVIYNISNIDYYEKKKNAIVLDIRGQTLNTINPGDNQSLQQLMVLLGITIPTKLVIMLEKTVSDAGVARWTYKLMNLNMDTVMVMKKST